ncbi:MAG: FAD-binding oxidoreductase [Flavobacteriales bacterium]|nr:FAD-binding oxidoreductase [Flavobacteriales bacterium]
MQTENLIVGLGIAGLNLCHQLEKAGKSFIVIDNCPTNSASLIAGGIYNPVVFKRKLKSWKADVLIPTLVEAYDEIDARLNITSLHHQFPILKPITSIDDLGQWQRVIQEERLIPYVESIEMGSPEGPFKEGIIANTTIQNGGFLRIGKTLLAYRDYLKKKGLLIQDAFDYSDLHVNASRVEYKDILANRIIFSEGRFISENPYFSWVPFKPTKGQILTVKTDGSLTADRIYNHQFLLFPTEQKDVFKLGATYEWDRLDEIPTNASTDELLSKAEKVLNVKVEVLEEKAAIRPTVVDRRPVLGAHPEYKNIFLFNGMGTKGVMIAPYFAKQLVDFIYTHQELDSEVSLNRFLRRHYKKE